MKVQKGCPCEKEGRSGKERRGTKGGAKNCSEREENERRSKGGSGMRTDHGRVPGEEHILRPCILPHSFQSIH